MKLTPPIPEILDEKPFGEDIFQRKAFGDSLTSLFTSITESLVVAVDAKWGDGKTTFAKMWTKDLQQAEKHCIYFDAFKHDYSTDPFIAFSAEIISLIGFHFSDLHNDSSEFQEKAKKVALSLVSISARLSLKALTLGIIRDNDIDAIQSVATEIADTSSKAFESIINDTFQKYVADQEAAEKFKNVLSDLGKAVRKKQSLPLLIVIDELDRCRPDFALTLLERIKHFFLIPNVSFLILADFDQLESYIRTVYGPGIDAKNYLRKFFHVTAQLPKDRKSENMNAYFKYTNLLCNHYLGDRSTFADEETLKDLFQYYDFSLREMEHCFSSLAVYYAKYQEESVTVPSILAFLSVCKIRFPKILSQMQFRKISFEVFIRETQLSTNFLDQYHPRYKLTKELEALLMSNEEVSRNGDSSYLRWADHFSTRHRCNRTAILPYLCSEFSAFSYSA